jgi:hypothetical protein
MVRAFGSSLIPFLTLALSLPACVGVDHANKDSGKAGSGGAAGDGSGATGSGATGSGATGSGGKKGTGGSGGKDEGPPPTNSTPSLDSFDAHVTGREGDDITLSASGTDAEGDVLFLSTKFTDSAGNPVNVFDTHWNGVADGPEDRLLFDASLVGDLRFDGTVTLPGFGSRYRDAAKVVVHLEDEAGNLSEDQTFDIGQQAEKLLGEACDPDILESRCTIGLSCTGKKPVCTTGGAPDLTNVLYARSSENGPRLLAAGADPDDDLAALRLEFFDNAGAPVKIDLDGDQIADKASWDLDVYGSSVRGSFFVFDQMGLGFDAVSPKMKVTPIDGQGTEGATKTITISAPFEQADLHPCDYRGFDTCGQASLCAPGLARATNSCTTLTSVRKTLCSSAPVLDPAKSVTKVYGRAEGVSVWDPPAGCTQVGWTHRPEGLAKVHLSTAAKRLTLSTAVPETRIDTVLYLIPDTVPNCGAPVTARTLCNDDFQGYSSSISAANVAAGNYIVVIDSANEEGGSYGLTLTVE